MIWASTAGQSLCRVDVYIGGITGTITGKTFVAKVYSTDAGANPTLVTLLGTSSGVSGSALTASTWATFTFATPVTLPSNYVITITGGASDYNNWIQLKGSASNGNANWKSGQWDGLTYNNQMDIDPAMKLYQMQ
jgi:hypothetical protein